MRRIQDLLRRLYAENYVPKDDMIWLLENLDEESRELLFDYARKTRDGYYGNRVFMRGLIEFSNICSKNCIYCGIRAGNQNVDRYRLTKEEILACCKEGYFCTAKRRGQMVYSLKGGRPGILYQRVISRCSSYLIFG